MELGSHWEGFSAFAGPSGCYWGFVHGRSVFSLVLGHPRYRDGSGGAGYRGEMLSPVVPRDTGVGSCLGMRGPTWLPASLQGFWFLGAP